MKKLLLTLSLIFLIGSSFAQYLITIGLNQPDTNRGFPIMKALKHRASVNKFDTTSLKLQDISDLLWAANGINRPEIGKRTAPSAMNCQDIDVYALMKTGAYLYDAAKNTLNLVALGDHRKLAASQQDFVNDAPIICLMVSDISRFTRGNDSTKMVWAAEDAGMVSQNIGLFCAGVGLATRPRVTMDADKLKVILKLKPSQHLMLNNPVSYCDF